VAGLKDDIFIAGELDQFGRLGGVVGHRFFHEHGVLPAAIKRRASSK